MNTQNFNQVFGFNQDIADAIDKAEKQYEAIRKSKLDLQPIPVQNTVMNKTFNQAVLDTVEEIRAKQSFSIFDITRAMRNAVNTGQLFLTDRLPTTFSGRTSFCIEHSDVRQIFVDALQNGTISGLSRSFNDHGGYNVYENEVQPIITQATQPTTSIAPVAPVAPVLTKVNTKPNLVDARKLETYLKKKTGAVTMKQIQSRFDTLRDISCEDYAILLNTLGYTVDKTAKGSSHWTVTV